MLEQQLKEKVPPTHSSEESRSWGAEEEAANKLRPQNDSWIGTIATPPTSIPANTSLAWPRITGIEFYPSASADGKSIRSLKEGGYRGMTK